jgi:Flp pilus assembly protein TadD
MTCETPSTSGTSPFDEALSRAVEAHRAGDFTAAGETYRALLAERPDSAAVLHLLGLVEQAMGRPAEAEGLILRALGLHEDPVFRGNLALLYQATNRPAEAEAEYLRVLKGYPDLTAVVWNHARLLRDQGRWAEALTGFDRVAALSPETADAHLDRALVLERLGRRDEAEDGYRRGLDLARDHLGALINLGTLLVNGWRNIEAEGLFRRAARAHPDSSDAWGSLGVALANLGRADEAEACYRRSLQIEPDNPKSRLNLGMLVLGQGDFAAGWPLFEARHEAVGAHPAPPPAEGCRPWSGEPLAGRSLLVIGEQGLGDQMQFVRYAPMAKRVGASRVIVAVSPELVRLVRCVPGVDEVVALGSETPVAADDWAWMMSLPRLFGTDVGTIGAALPADFPQFHLSPDEGPGATRALGEPMEVGLFWAGRAWNEASALRRFDDRRSVDFETLAPLLMSPALIGRVRWTLLQKDRRQAGLAELARAEGWRDPFGEDATESDLLDTARIVAGLDLVIGVDSALIHLAAGLGRPTWMIDRFAHCWRWVGDRDESDWYPDLRIFRQARPGAWGEVIARVERALLEVAAHRPWPAP